MICKRGEKTLEDYALYTKKRYQQNTGYEKPLQNDWFCKHLETMIDGVNVTIIVESELFTLSNCVLLLIKRFKTILSHLKLWTARESRCCFSRDYHKLITLDNFSIKPSGKDCTDPLSLNKKTKQGWEGGVGRALRRFMKSTANIHAL